MREEAVGDTAPIKRLRTVGPYLHCPVSWSGLQKAHVCIGAVSSRLSASTDARQGPLPASATPLTGPEAASEVAHLSTDTSSNSSFCRCATWASSTTVMCGRLGG